MRNAYLTVAAAMRRKMKAVKWLPVFSLVLVAASSTAGISQAGVLLVAGSPEYDSATNSGLKNGSVMSWPGSGLNNSGTAVGYAEKFVSGANLSQRAVRWDGSGTAATELGNLGLASNGSTSASAYDVNDAGTAVGYADKWVAGTALGSRAVRWDGSGTAATELGNLGTSSGGSTAAYAYAVNDAGTAVGVATKYTGGTSQGYRAVRWDAAGTAATELGNLGTDISGSTTSYAYAVNNSGTTVGYAIKYVGSTSQGSRAVRWDGSGTAATELGHLGTSSSGSTNAYAVAVNDADTAVGYAMKYVGHVSQGYRAVRWDAAGTAATELGHLGTSSSGSTSAGAYAVNDAGTAVGNAIKHEGGIERGLRAVRWDASGTTATELGNLGTDSSGTTYCSASAVNNAGTAVGNATKYVAGVGQGYRAVIWLPDASVIDLNDLGVAPVSDAGTWTLTAAQALSADGWVAGQGTFDADGAGPLAGYTRLWVAQVGLGGTWISAAGGTWGRGPNWSTGTPAMQVGNATFNLNANYTVGLDRDETTKTITVNAGTVTIEGNGHSLTTENGLTVASGARLNVVGMLQVGNGGPAGSLSGDIDNNGRLILNWSDTYSYNDTISGSGGVTKQGAGTLTLSAANTYTGPTSITGGTLKLASSGTIANSSAIDLSGGTLDLTAKSSGFSLAAGQMLRGNGTVQMAAGQTLTVSAGVAPSHLPGALTIAGNLALGGTSSFEVDGWTAGRYDLVQGTAANGERVTFGGTLNIDIETGFGGSMKLFDFDLYGGAFSTVNFTGLVGDRSVTFDTATGVLTVIGDLLAGDSNGDGLCNYDDLSALINNYGVASGATWSMCDFTDDGVVNFDDLSVIVNNYGGGTGLDAQGMALLTAHGLGGAAVPEPGTLALVMILVSSLLCHRSLRHRFLGL